MLAAREKLRPLLKTSKDSSLWRRDEKNFHPEGQHPQGSVDLSPGWFQQAHDVSILAHELYSSAAHFKSGDVATTPAGFCELQGARCIGLAGLHLGI
jgi:hypothetical protein